MEADKSPRSKRMKKTPIRFQPWQEGDPHSPMAMRSQKLKLKKDQKKYREMKKDNPAKDDSTAKETEGAGKQAKLKKKKGKLPEKNPLIRSEFKSSNVF